jgi:hypothetical protein
MVPSFDRTSRKAAPRASATARRATAFLFGWLQGADEGAHELPLDLRRDYVHIYAFAPQELSCASRSTRILSPERLITQLEMNDINGAIGQRDVFDLALEEFDVRLSIPPTPWDYRSPRKPERPLAAVRWSHLSRKA